jgi:ABC-type branched-subunit amino acid transport system ATPase component
VPRIDTIKPVTRLLPQVKERRNPVSGALSNGEQQEFEVEWLG